MLKLGQEQGMPASMLNSVPVVYVKGKLLLGFNEAELSRLLGK